MFDPSTIKEHDFEMGKPVIILLHGYTGHKDFSPNTEIRPAYQKYGAYNIISIDYGPLVLEPCYIQAVLNLPVVARCTAELIDYMISQKFFQLDDFHVIGFSLGAQTAGMIANHLKSGKLKRITGLDPAKPLFISAPENKKLDRKDARFVDVIHTDILERGVWSACGQIDFYVNGGIEQPGCNLQKNMSTGSCNHNRAPEYYAESLDRESEFWAYKCNTWFDWFLERCQVSKTDEVILMGFNTSDKSEGLYFLNTNKMYPFAQGVIPDLFFNEVDFNDEPENYNND